MGSFHSHIRLTVQLSLISLVCHYVQPTNKKLLHIYNKLFVLESVFFNMIFLFHFHPFNIFFYYYFKLFVALFFTFEKNQNHDHWLCWQHVIDTLIDFLFLYNSFYRVGSVSLFFGISLSKKCLKLAHSVSLRVDIGRLTSLTFQRCSLSCATLFCMHRKLSFIITRLTSASDLALACDHEPSVSFFIFSSLLSHSNFTRKYATT